MFSPNSNPPAVHITNMLEGTLWAGLWDPASKVFSFHQVDDFSSRQQGMPLEMLYNAKGDRLFVTTAKPGFVNLYDNSDPRQPKFLKTIRRRSRRAPQRAVAGRALPVRPEQLPQSGRHERWVHHGDRPEVGEGSGEHRHAEGAGIQSQLHHAVAGISQATCGQAGPSSEPRRESLVR